MNVALGDKGELVPYDCTNDRVLWEELRSKKRKRKEKVLIIDEPMFERVGEYSVGLSQVFIPRKSRVSRYSPDGVKSSIDYDFKTESGAYIKVYESEYMPSRVKIPSNIEGVSVYFTTDNMFEFVTKVKSVFIEDGIIGLGKGTFRSCTNVVWYDLCESLEIIGAGCFYNNTSLKKIIMPEGLKKVHPSAFLECSNLEVIYVPNERVGKLIRTCELPTNCSVIISSSKTLPIS